MFRIVCAILTVIAMLAHSVLGCGVCHAACRHADCAQLGHRDSEQAEHHEHLSCGVTHQDLSCEHEDVAVDDHESPCSSDEQTPHPPGKPCASMGCSYVGMNVVKLPVLDKSSELLPCDLLAVEAPAQLECVARAVEGYRAGYPPALRAQIWLGAWLV